MNDCYEFLNIFFNKGEYACFGLNVAETYYINSWEDEVNSDHINSCERVSLNPLLEHRKDSNVTAFRNFMIESDTLSLAESIEHIKQSKIPVSCCVFSGNKSMHFYICLEEDLKDVHTYKFVGKWILNILGCKQDLVDSSTFTPSRLARLGNARNNKTGRKQNFKKIKGKIPNKVLEQFLLDNISFKPEIIKQETVRRSTTPNQHLLSSWTKYVLDEGIYSKKKNNTFYQIAHDFYSCGFDQEQCFDYICAASIDIIKESFCKKELYTTINSAYKKLLTNT